MRNGLSHAALLLSFLSPAFVHALQPMDETDLAEVTGRDGLAVTIDSSGISADAIRWVVDPGSVNEAAVQMEGVSINAVNNTGTVVGGDFGFSASLDVGSDGTEAAVAISMELDRVRLRINDLRHEGDISRSYGTMALDGSARLDFINSGGIFNNQGSGPLNNQGGLYLRGEINDANLFYRQLWHQHPYLVLSNFNALWNIEGGVLGITNEGIRTAAPFIDVALDFDLMYKFPFGPYAEAQEFIISGNERPITHFGWLGALKDAELIWKPGGAWYGTTGTPQQYDRGNKSEGINFSSRWNYVTYADTVAGGGSQPNSREFRWQFGEGNGMPNQGMRFELSDWRSLPGAVDGYGHNWPLIALDVINAGQGPGGLCWGGPQQGPSSVGGACTNTSTQQFVNLPPGDIRDFDPSAPRTDASALALMVRDGNLLTYSNRVKLIEDGAIVREFDWGLIYTLANVDANIYFYPGGNPSDPGGGSLSRGIIADIMLMSQSFDPDTPSQQGLNWDQGSHFMIADTAAGKGIGFLGVSFMMLANDTRIWLRPDWSGSNFYDVGIDVLSREARLAFRGTFGGGNIPDGSDLLRGTFVDANLEGLLNLRLSPSRPGATIAADGGVDFLGYSLAARLADTDVADFSADASGGPGDPGSYISLAEPGRPDVNLVLGNISGDIALVNGVIDLRSDSEEGDGFPKLVIANDIQFGQTANARMINAVEGSSLPGGNAAQPFRIDSVSFSGNPLGSIVVPSGQWHSSITLRPQTPSP